MAVQRGISVAPASRSFEHEGLAFNLSDKPGRQDFSEDTYRNLTAIDSAVMILDAAKGIGEQSFARCAEHHLCVNKLDREGRDPFDLIDEIQPTRIRWLRIDLPSSVGKPSRCSGRAVVN